MLVRRGDRLDFVRGQLRGKCIRPTHHLDHLGGDRDGDVDVVHKIDRNQFAGVLAAPVVQVAPLMGSNLIIVVFAVVVIGGMGSILGSVATGIGLGLIEGLTRVFYPEGSSIVVFVVMVIVLLVRPAGLFGRKA